MAFRYFCGTSLAIWCIQRERKPVLQECFSGIYSWFSPDNRCHELVSGRTGDCWMFLLFWFSPSMPMCLGIIVPSVIDNCFLLDIWVGSVEVEYALYYIFISVISLIDFCVCIQPALLYIVPAVIGFLAAHCIWNGEVKQVCSATLCSCA